MKNIGVGSSLINELGQNNALLDGRVLSINLYANNSSVTLQLDIQPRAGSLSGILRLVFQNVKEFYFNYEDEVTFFYIQRYKLFQKKEGDYYLCIDPFDETQIVSENDNGVVLAENISGILLNDQ